MKRYILLILVALLVLACNGKAQPLTGHITYTDEDVTVWEHCLSALSDKRALPVGDLVIEAALCFLGTPYVAATLEKEPEQLVINMREFDCTTFVETVVAIALTMKDYNPSFETYCLNLQRLRYRDGVINDYTGRLHYFSDWIYENERKGLVRDVTRQIGGAAFTPDVSFMSTHPDSYRQLKSNPRMIEVIRAKEMEISARESYAMIPSSRINSCSDGIKNGDIVCFVTNIKGLDVSHVGFVMRQNGVLRLLHASSAGKEVMIDKRLLQDYASAVKTTRGVMIVRLSH